jgi:cytochrome b561
MTISDRFPATSRILHWTMAAMIVAMLFIGVGMVTSPDRYHGLVSIHRPLGVAILVLAAIRLVNRQLRKPPSLPPDMPAPLKLVANASHVALYVLMFAVPLVGWAMLSAGAYPVVMFGGFVLPPIAPHDASLYALLRETHEVLAVLFFLTFLAHMAAALAHAAIFRDGVFQSMAGGRLTPD